MLGYYAIRTSVLVNGKVIRENQLQGYVIQSQEDTAFKIYHISWKNLNELYRKYGWYLPFNIWSLKKGRVISFFNGEHKDIKEWKTNPLMVELVIDYKEIPLSEIKIQDILNYHNGELAIQFLKEKGLTIS